MKHLEIIIEPSNIKIKLKEKNIKTIHLQNTLLS